MHPCARLLKVPIDFFFGCHTETDGVLDLTHASAADLRRYMVQDATLTPEPQLHKSEWSLADATQKGKKLSQEELESVVDKFARMLSTRSDYKDSSEFMDELRQLELNKSPPSWLPARMQQKSAAAQDTSADLQDLAQGSQLNAHNADSADTSSIQEHESPPVHSEAPSPPYSPSPITMQNPEDALVAVQLSSEGADIDLDDRPDHELMLEERDMRTLLDPILDDTFDMEAWPSLSKTVSVTHHRAKPHQQERDQRESLRPQENPTAAQTSPIAWHLQSTGVHLMSLQLSMHIFRID